MSEEKLTDQLGEEATLSKAPEAEASAEESNWKFDGAADTLSTELMADFQANKNAAKSKPTKATTKAEKGIKGDKALFTLLSVFVIVCIAALSVLGVLYYNMPNSNEKMNPGNVAVTVGNTKVSIGMYNYYYSVVSQDYINYSSYDGSLDTTKSYENQFTTDDDGNKISWAKLFEQKTIDQIKFISTYYELGVKDGVTLTSKQKENIKSAVDYLKESAASSEEKMSVDAYIAKNYGDYCGLATIQKLLNQTYIAENYYQKRLVEAKVSSAEAQAQYKNNSTKYNAMRIAYLQIPYGEDFGTDAKSTLAQANKYVKQIKSVNDMKKLIPVACKNIIDSYVSMGYAENAEACAEMLASSIEISITQEEEALDENASKWMFDKATKIGDCKAFDDASNSVVYIFYKVSNPEPDTTVVYSVRHILVTPETENENENENGSTVKYTDEEWAKAKEKADSILKKFNATDKSEYTFAKYAEAYTDDTESTSNGQSGLYGGLYAGTTLGTMVPEFENWSVDDARKYGDVEIVKSSFGYHIMFFVEKTEKYLYDCSQDLIQENEDQFIKSARIKQHKNAMKKTKVAQPVEASEQAE